MKWNRLSTGAHAPFVVLVVALLFLGLSACSNAFAIDARDPDAVTLVDLSRRAGLRAAEVVSNPVLRQVDVIPSTGRTIFYFTDTGATLEIDVDVPGPSTPADGWKVSSTSFSKLVGFQAPTMNMSVLHVGAVSMIRALAGQWDGCTVTAVTLLTKGSDLEWTGFCRLPDGRLGSGTLDNQTGEFVASPVPLAFPPPTATPE